MFGIGSLLYAILFFINGVAVLSEDRFLARIGWSTKSINNSNNNTAAQYGYGDYNMTGSNTNIDSGIKARIINLINATRTLLRIPLIVINVVVIIYELVLG
ncbi:hypothetical protein CANINC_002919 [Pichia inconspicua]|uniref:Yos1-like protein n=1 Tax=Pichia inconspicua TaxID=52247 RepID=A0A4T0X014_9ASCO|nr:hypothetical protein CANINC_002919 [[Candida] inconspicua]